jgi:cell division protein FtsB
MITPFRIFVVVLLVVIAGLQVRLWTGQGSFSHVNMLGEKVSLRSAENDSRRGRNAVLKAEILDLKQGLEAVEDIARSELGLIKKGEIFFLLVED